MRFNFAFLCAAASIAVAGCNSDSGKTASVEAGGSSQPSTHLKKLAIDDTKKGTGPVVENGDSVWVRYTGKLANGTVFDSNTGADKPPLPVTVGMGGVIKGWDLGLVGMQKGGTRKLSIPYNLAYGSKSPSAKIPPNSDLYFDLTLVEMMKPTDQDVFTVDIVKQGAGPEVKKGDTVTVEYKATVFGEEADSSKAPMTFKIGADQMAINGFDDALVGMKAGGERKITIPPRATMVLPNEKMRNNVVVFDVHLLKIQ